MAFSEFEIKRYERLLSGFMEKKRPPPHMREKIDLGYRIAEQSIEIFEIIPTVDASKKAEVPDAMAKYVQEDKLWEVYWLGGLDEWTIYEHMPTVKTLEEFLEIVAEDAHCHFFGEGIEHNII